MSSKKEGKGDAAADRIKAAALSATKGLPRAQAERAAAAAARNVNAYGQKEEGPSRWQERKEAKRQMYLLSTEKQVRLGVRKDKTNEPTMGGASQCQKCFQNGHWTYECKNERVYIARPSRSQIMKNPKLMQRTPVRWSDDFPEEDEQKKAKTEKKEVKVEKRSKKTKRKHRSDTESSSDDEASESDSSRRSSSVSGSDDSSDGDPSSYSSSSDSEDDRRKKRKSSRNNKKRKERRKRYSSSSESSDYDSSSDSDSGKNHKKSKKRSSKR